MAGEGKHIGLVDRHDGAFDLVGKSAEIAPPFRMIFELTEHFGKEFSVVVNLDFGEPFGIRGHQVRQPQHQFAALGRGHRCPRALAHDA
jgi:hypothetical protein